MSYNPQNDRSILISKFHHRLLRALADKNARKKRGELENLIYQAALKAKIPVADYLREVE